MFAVLLGLEVIENESEQVLLQDCPDHSVSDASVHICLGTLRFLSSWFYLRAQQARLYFLSPTKIKKKTKKLNTTCTGVSVGRGCAYARKLTWSGHNSA